MEKIEKIREKAKAFFSTAKGSHDFEHVERVFKLCMHIGKREKADTEILAIAALLHDIGREEEDKTNGKICHAKKGAEMAREMLEKDGMEKQKIDKIVHCIETHRFRGNKNPKIPESLEAKILFDSDKLDSIGSVGIGRAFLFAGEIGATLHNKEQVDSGKTKAYTKEDTAYREFAVKLSKIRDKMLTTEGKRMAEERHRFMTEFFQRLDREVAGEL